MADSYYMQNRKKMLLMVKELHKRGFGKLRIVPSVAPNGLHWRCSFIDKTKGHEFPASQWIYKIELKSRKLEIKQSPEELADLFMQENNEFLHYCKGDNQEYVKWYSKMTESLKESELPYAFSEDFTTTDYWLTSEGSKIQTLPNEKEYNFHD
jgi:hypothetical protein